MKEGSKRRKRKKTKRFFPFLLKNALTFDLTLHAEAMAEKEAGVPPVPEVTPDPGASAAVAGEPATVAATQDATAAIAAAGADTGEVPKKKKKASKKALLNLVRNVLSAFFLLSSSARVFVSPSLFLCLFWYSLRCLLSALPYQVVIGLRRSDIAGGSGGEPVLSPESLFQLCCVSRPRHRFALLSPVKGLPSRRTVSYSLYALVFPWPVLEDALTSLGVGLLCCSRCHSLAVSIVCSVSLVWCSPALCSDCSRWAISLLFTLV